MHGTLPDIRRPPVRRAAAIVRKTAIAAAAMLLTGVALAAAYQLINATEQGHSLFIQWGLEEPGGCG